MIKHVKPTRLSVCRGLAAAALGCLALSANAYQNLTPPSGWAAGGGAGGSVTGTKTAVNAMFSTGSMSTSASISVGGRAVSVPVTMRYAPAASRVAATAVMLYPPLRTVSTIAGWLGLAGLAYNATEGFWTQPDTTSPKSDGYQYFAESHMWQTMSQTYQGACSAYQSIISSSKPGSFVSLSSCSSNLVRLNVVTNGVTADFSSPISRYAVSSCPSGWYVTPAGCVQTPPPKSLTQDQAIEELTKQPMPAEVPKHIPTPLPVETPEWQPLFIPTGNPVPNPNYKPNEAPSPTNQPYVQPGVKVEPAPSPGAPWQADVKPVNRPTASPTGSTEPSTESSTNPSNDTPRQDQKEDQDFCDKHKESIICAEADTPEQDLPTGKLDISYNYVDIFGNGSCPSDAYLNTHGMSLKVWDWAATCDNVQTYFRPVLIACCAFAAFVIVAAGGKE